MDFNTMMICALLFAMLSVIKNWADRSKPHKTTFTTRSGKIYSFSDIDESAEDVVAAYLIANELGEDWEKVVNDIVKCKEDK